MSDEYAISVRGLRKSYGPVHAVDGLDLDVARGEVVALLGPNGAGKTTTVEILEGFRHRDSGTVTVLGADPASAGRSWRARIGMVLQLTAEPELTVAEMVGQFAGYYPRPRDPGEVIELVGLGGMAGRLAHQLAGGQRRRLDVALGIVGRPELLFLDEPTTGFDPGARRDAWQMVRELRASGTTILLTTHDMEEAQALADRVVVLSGGTVVAQGSPAVIGGRQTARTRIAFSLPPGWDASELPVPATADGDGRLVVETDQVTRRLQQLTTWAVERGGELAGLSVVQPSLEEVYLQLTQHDAPDGAPERSTR